VEKEKIEKNSSGKNLIPPIHGFHPSGSHEKTFQAFFSRKPRSGKYHGLYASNLPN